MEGPVTEEILQKARIYVALYFNPCRIPEGVSRALRYLTPVLRASDCGAINEIIANKKNGLVVEPDADKIAQALDQSMLNPVVKENASKEIQLSLKTYSNFDSVVKSLVE
jgi:glycosyltransferase involved in cell wall biosynthesis